MCERSETEKLSIEFEKKKLLDLDLGLDLKTIKGSNTGKTKQNKSKQFKFDRQENLRIE